MSDKPAKQREHIRWPKVVVILLLATIGFMVFWQFVLEGRLTPATPEQVVREFLRLGLPNPDSLEIDEVSVLQEMPEQDRHVKAAVLRVRFRARDELGRLASFDKILVVIGDQVKSAQDYSPELESQVQTLIDKLRRQK
jgi:hypothetical protein